MNGGRANQKARTRAALLQAATELEREGRPPSMPDAAERAMVSVATAYRYFSSAEDLWYEAADATVLLAPALARTSDAIEAAGDDPVDRLDALLRTTGFAMIDDQVPFRRLAKAALDQWFSQQDSPEAEREPVREGRRNRLIAEVVEPLGDSLPPAAVQRLARALALVVGTDAMIALVDGARLSDDEAKAALLDAGRWLLNGALAELR